MSPDTPTYERIEKELARLQGIAVAVRAALKQEPITFDELPKSVESLQADLAEARRQVEEAKAQFDRHVEWASDQAQAAEARVRALEQRDKELAKDMRYEARYVQAYTDCANRLEAWADRLDPPAKAQP